MANLPIYLYWKETGERLHGDGLRLRFCAGGICSFRDVAMDGTVFVSERDTSADIWGIFPKPQSLPSPADLIKAGKIEAVVELQDWVYKRAKNAGMSVRDWLKSVGRSLGPEVKEEVAAPPEEVPRPPGEYVVQYWSDEDKEAADILGGHFGVTPIKVSSVDELPKADNILIVGAQEANPVFKFFVDQGIFRGVTEDDAGWILIQAGMWDDSWVFGVASWSREDTIASAKDIVEAGLPSKTIRKERVLPPPPPEEITWWDSIWSWVTGAIATTMNAVYKAITGRDPTKEDVIAVSKAATWWWPAFNVVSKTLYGVDLKTGEPATWEDVTADELMWMAADIGTAIIGASILGKIGSKLVARGGAKMANEGLQKIVAGFPGAIAKGASKKELAVATREFTKAVTEATAKSTRIPGWMKVFAITEIPQLIIMGVFGYKTILEMLGLWDRDKKIYFQLKDISEDYKTKQYAYRDASKADDQEQMARLAEEKKELANRYKTTLDINRTMLEEAGYYDQLELHFNMMMKVAEEEAVPLPKKKTKIQISTDPPGANVYYDGVLWPYPTPTTLEGLEDKEYTFRIEKEGYDVYEFKETPTPEGVIVPKISLVPLKPETGAISVISYPDGADIFLDGVLWPYPTNTTITDVEPGSHRLQVKKSGYEDSPEVTVFVTAGETAVQEFTLKKKEIPPEKATLSIQTGIPEVEVWLGDKKLGVTDENGKLTIEVDPFSGDVTFKKEGYKDYVRYIIAKPGEETKVVVSADKMQETKKAYLVTFLSEPPGAAVYINGARLTRGGKEVFTDGTGILLPGTYTVTMRKPGYKEWSATLELHEFE